MQEKWVALKPSISFYVLIFSVHALALAGVWLLYPGFLLRLLISLFIFLSAIFYFYYSQPLTAINWTDQGMWYGKLKSGKKIAMTPMRSSFFGNLLCIVVMQDVLDKRLKTQWIFRWQLTKEEFSALSRQLRLNT